MACSEIDEFLSGPLVQWFVSCLEDRPDSVINYYDLVDGVLLHSVFLQIDPAPINDAVLPTNGSNAQRIDNLEMIVGNIKQFYKEELGNLIIRQPEAMNLGNQPESHVPDAQLLLLLLLGCAVQCPNKEKFITRIKTLTLDTQLAIVECIKQVTDQSNIVIARDVMENEKMLDVFGEIERLLRERDLFREKWKVNALSGMFEIEDDNKMALNKTPGKLEREKNYHFVVELADWKSKLRKQRQELDEKTEALLECSEEIEHNKASLAKLKQENQELVQAARNAKSYRDELDVANERAERADRLEIEVEKYREKLTDIEFYKTRIEELREDNRVLIENREMLEEQLSSSRRNAEKVLELQAQIIDYEQLVTDLTLKHTAATEKYQELFEENCQLQKSKKATADEAALDGLFSDSEEPDILDNSLSEQLTNNAQTRALKLELENRRLMTLIDSLKENSFYEQSSRAVELQRERKELALKIDSLSDANEHLSDEKCETEMVCKQALEENNKLQTILKNQKNSFERQQQEYQTQQGTIVELENNYDRVTKEKRRIQLLLKSAQKRADDLERWLEISNQKLDKSNAAQLEAKKVAAKCYELETELAILEKDKENAMRDVRKCRDMIEEKDLALDKLMNNIDILKKKVMQLQEEIKNSVTEISRLQEIERSSKKSNCRAAIDRDTLETLQSNLVAEKLNNQQLSTVLGKLGLTVEMLLTLPLENILDRISQIPDVIDCIKTSIVDETMSDKQKPESKIDASVYVASITKNLQEIIDSQKREIESYLMRTNASEKATEQLQSEKAKLEVTVTTLRSESTSLTSQQTALQLTNSQLVAEKEELLKDHLVNQRVHEQLVNDQVTLQSLHEQLTTEYEKILCEREDLKRNLRNAKNATRVLRETCQRLDKKNKSLNADLISANENSNCLEKLRYEHTNLKDDFTNLYTATKNLNIEHRNLQDNYRKTRMEMNRLTLRQTEMQGELSGKNNKCATMELEINKLNQSSTILLEANSTLESNRRSLMDHMSLLFTQYHELLTHSFEDKEHYHMEEKSYTNKVNHLYRQKEKLEEKIMENYRNMESCSMKKRGFGARFVKKVRKAGSELLHKNRRSWIDDSKQLESIETYEFESGCNDTIGSIDNQCVTGLAKSPIYKDTVCRVSDIKE